MNWKPIVLDKPVLDIKWLGSVGDLDGPVVAARLENRCIHRISQVRGHHDIAQVRLVVPILHWKDDLDPAIEVPLHQIGATEVEFVVAVVMEVIHPAVLEKSPNNASDADRLAPAWDAGPEAANPSNDQVNFDAGLRRRVQRAYKIPIDQRVHLEDQPPVAGALVHRDFARDLVKYPLAKVHRRHE